MAVIQVLEIDITSWHEASKLVLIGMVLTATPIAYICEKLHDREIGVAKVFAEAQSAVDDVEDDEEDFTGVEYVRAKAIEQRKQELEDEIIAKQDELTRLQNQVA